MVLYALIQGVGLVAKQEAGCKALFFCKKDIFMSDGTDLACFGCL
jgi:hypothetical protein